MEKDYQNLVNTQIELDKLLAVTKPKYHKQLKNLFEHKKAIIQKNGLFADLELKKINKKIQKLKQK